MKKLAIKDYFPTINGEPLKIIFIVDVSDVTGADVKGFMSNQTKTKIKHLTNSFGMVSLVRGRFPPK